ncbi:MAG: PfkB family carbohydrate kinase [Nannocystaceae bacterium]
MLPPDLWLVGGVDPTGGAGLTRDRITAQICAPGRIIHEVVTADTQQGHGAPATATARPAIEVVSELRCTATDVVKVGLVPKSLTDELHGSLAKAAAVVVDPVLRASDGGDLGGSVAGYRKLSSVATLVTPNTPEAAALAGCARDDRDLLVRVVAALGGVSVLLKGGHGRDAERVCDRLWHAGEVVNFARPRVPGDPRGTGCALATAIACGLAAQRKLVEAVADAIKWLDSIRTQAHPGPDGRLHLPDSGPGLRG